MADFVYVAANDAMPGLVKIGRTCNLARRMAELSADTGVPLPFRVVDAVPAWSAVAVEARMHAFFAGHRVSGDREFFRLDASIATAVLRQMAPPITEGQIIDMPPRGLRGLWRRWWEQPFLAQAIQVLFVAGVLPWLIIFGGLALAGLWDAIVGG